MVYIYIYTGGRLFSLQGKEYFHITDEYEELRLEIRQLTDKLITLESRKKKVTTVLCSMYTTLHCHLLSAKETVSTIYMYSTSTRGEGFAHLRRKCVPVRERYAYLHKRNTQTYA